MGRYVVEARLGAGGMAEVFRATLVGAEGFSRAVALKRVAASLSEDERFASMFIAEARIAALLSHPNIVTVLDFDRDEEGRLFLAMGLVDGADLRTICQETHRRGERVSPSTAVFVIAEVLRGLAYAHSLEHGGRALGIVHRDVSTHNVLVSRDGLVKLADFGIAKATASASVSTTVKGKISYMSPEQASAAPLDGRADVYAAGVMLYELLCGTRPYDGATEAETLANLLRGRPAPIERHAPDVPSDLAAVTMKMFAAERDLRPASAAEALEAVRSCACFPTNGEAELGRRVRELVGASASAGRPVARIEIVPRARARAADERRGPSRRTLGALGLVAAVSAATAGIVWFGPSSDSAAPSAAPVAAVPGGPEDAEDSEDPEEPASDPDVLAAGLDVEDETRAPIEAPGEAPFAHGAHGTGAQGVPPPGAERGEKRGSLSIRVSPWANVQVDGESWGATPVRRRLKAGRHKLSLQNEDLSRRESFTVDVKAGEELRVYKDWR